MAVQGDKVRRSGQGTAYGGFGLVDDEAVDGDVLKRSLAGEAAFLALADGLLDGAEFPLAHHDEVSQAFFDGPIDRRRAPIEAGLVELRGEFTGLLLNLFKLAAIELEFGDGHSVDYSEDGPALL